MYLSPTIKVMPQAYPVGSNITVAGENFAYLRNVEVQVDGVKATLASTDHLWRFNATIIVPTLKEGVHTIRAVDALGNVAKTTFYVNLGFDTIDSEMQSLNEQV